VYARDTTGRQSTNRLGGSGADSLRDSHRSYRPSWRASRFDLSISVLVDPSATVRNYVLNTEPIVETLMSTCCGEIGDFDASISPRAVSGNDDRITGPTKLHPDHRYSLLLWRPRNEIGCVHVETESCGVRPQNYCCYPRRGCCDEKDDCHFE